MMLESLSASCAVHNASTSGAESACARTAVIFISDLSLEPGSLDDLRPFRNLGADVLREPFGRARDGFVALLVELRNDVRLLQNLHEFAVDSHDDRARRIGRRDEPL